MANDADILSEAKEAFQVSSDSEQENRTLAEIDLRFSRLGDQWDADILRVRKDQDRPTLTINRMPSFIRQVVNDARQNKPSIKVSPVDSFADIKTAQVINGIFRSIESNSKAKIAYDTAADFAATMGWGYFLIDVDYAGDDTWDQDIKILRVANPFTVFGDPYDDGADSENWDSAFVTKMMPKKRFEAEFPDADPVNWDETGYTKLDLAWFDGDELLLAEWWTREQIKKTVLLLSDESVVAEKVYQENRDAYDAAGLGVTADRQVKSHSVTHRLLTGQEVLETTDWPGKYIPIIPVYGDEINIMGRRIFRSLIRDSLDAQRMYNYWRTASTELVALAPKAPWIGPEKAFQGADVTKWETANTESWAFLSYKGETAPERVPFAGPPAGAVHEAMTASDDIKATMGMFDASLGARSNETSGKAIMARQREGDVSTFHFQDNMARAIRHGGAVVLDLIPHVYSTRRIMRILGPDGKSEEVAIGKKGDQAPEGISEIYDLSVGKYDLAMQSGPSYTTRRQETADQMMEFIRVFPQAAPVIGDLLVRNLDWEKADEVAERLKTMLPDQMKGGPDPRLQQAMELIQKLQAELQSDEADRAVEEFKAAIKAYDAETKRMKMQADAVIAVANPAGPYDRFENGGD